MPNAAVDRIFRSARIIGSPTADVRYLSIIHRSSRYSLANARFTPYVWAFIGAVGHRGMPNRDLTAFEGDGNAQDEDQVERQEAL